MKQSIFSVLIISIIGVILSTGMTSCRKDKFQPTIKQYDSIQIVNYIAANNLTGFQRDMIGGDTTGMYYKILSPGSGTPIQYSDKITFVYTERTLDGTYVTSDTIANHYYDYVGHLYTNHFPLGLQTAVYNLLKYPNASMRVLIPSHLAYGKDGTGSGSSQVANNRIAGNESLDVYVHAITDFAAYDESVIKNYLAANGLSGYSTTPDGIHYSVLTPGTNSDSIVDASTITCTYTGQLLNATIFDGSYNGTNIATFPMGAFATPGNVEALEKYAVAGTKLSVILPSAQGYGIAGTSGIPPFSCLRFTWQVITVTP